jgi:HEAT repeat protein
MKICPALEKVPGLEDWAWFDTKDVRGEGAYVAFRILGPAGAPAIPSLLKVAKQPGESIPRYRAIEALGGIGQQSLTALLSIATNQIEYDMVRYSAAKNIGRFGIQARPAIPDLLNMLEDSDSNAAAGAAEALGNIPFEQAQISQVVPALAKASLQPGFMRQQMAILALGKLGPLASQAIPALLTASQEPNSFISITAKNSIAQIQPGACTDASTQ